MLHLLLFDRSKFFRVEEQRPISHGGHRLVGLVTLNNVLRSGREDCGVSLHEDVQDVLDILTKFFRRRHHAAAHAVDLPAFLLRVVIRK